MELFTSPLIDQLNRIESKLDKLLEKKKPVKPRASKKHEYDEFFEVMIWTPYPKVEGANKSKAYACYQKRLSEGTHYDYIAVCVRNYAALCRETDRKVMLPATFLGIHKHYENDWTVPTQAETMPKNNNELEAWALNKNIRSPRPGESWDMYRSAVAELYRQGG